MQAVSRNSANKLSYMYQITDVLFSDIDDLMTLRRMTLSCVSYDVSYNNGRTIEEQEMYE